MDIKYTITLTNEEATKVKDKVKELGLEIVDNPQRSQNKPFAIICSLFFDIEAGLQNMSEEQVKTYARKAYIIEKQKDFRTELRHTLGISTGVRETATKVRGDQLAQLEAIKDTMTPEQYELTRQIILGQVQ